MNIQLDLFSFIILFITVILIFIALILLSRKKNIQISKTGLIFNEKNNDVMYYITELILTIERKSLLNNIEKIDNMMTYTEQVLDIFYTNIIENIRKSTDNNNDIDFYIYRIALEKNRNYILSALKKEYKKIDNIILQNWDTHIIHLSNYFWNKAIENLDFLLKSELRDESINKIRDSIKEYFYNSFKHWILEIQKIYIEYNQIDSKLNEKISNILLKFGGNYENISE